MDEAVVILITSLLIAVLVRVFWRVIVNLLVIGAISLVIAAIFFLIVGVQHFSGSI